MQDIRGRVQVHVPFLELRDRYLDTILREGLQPEISFGHAALDSCSRETFADMAETLRRAGRTVTFHAPFLDLRPGAVDPRIREATAARLDQVCDLVPLFRPRSVVFHPCFDPRYYPNLEEAWLEASLATWRRVLERLAPHDTLLCLENVYETRPGPLVRLFAGLASSRARFCFDTGHCQVLSQAPWEEWIDALGPHLGQVHLHDNHGRWDEHLPVGEGDFPFASFFARLQADRIQPIWTLEAHSVEHLRRSLEGLARHWEA